MIIYDLSPWPKGLFVLRKIQFPIIKLWIVLLMDLRNSKKVRASTGRLGNMLPELLIYTEYGHWLFPHALIVFCLFLFLFISLKNTNGLINGSSAMCYIVHRTLIHLSNQNETKPDILFLRSRCWGLEVILGKIQLTAQKNRLHLDLME